MKNYVIINGVNSNTITGLMINELPPITKPQMRAIQEEIDGRDGDITTNLGYSAYDKTITIGLFETGYDINNIISFFNGEGTIVFSNEPDKYYNFKILNQIDYVSLQKFKSASITFHCQPFKYPLTETPLEIEYSYVSDEGETISLNTALGEMKVNLLGNTSQTGTPTPSNPIPVNVVSGDNEVVVCGKNLIPLTNQDFSIGDLHYSVNGGVLQATGSRNPEVQRNNNNFKSNFNFTLPAGTYTIKYTEKGTKTGTQNLYIMKYSDDSEIQRIYATSNTFTLNEETKVYLGIYSYQLSITGTIEYEIMLESGSTATDFEPYQSQTYEVDLGDIELCKIGTYQDKFIRNSGKQLWQGNKDYTGTGTVAQIHQTLAPGTYTASYKQSVNGTVQFNLKDSNGSVVQAITTYAVAGNSTATFTITSNEVSDIWLYLSVNMTVNDIMLNEGSTALPYEPYGNGDLYLEKHIEKVVLDGSEDEDWVSAGSYQRYLTTVSDFTSPIGSSTANILCNKLIATSKNNVAFVDNAISGGDENNHKMFVRIDNTITTVAQLRTFLSNNSLLVYYQLSSPTYTKIEGTLKDELDEVYRASSFEGTTNISQVNNDKAFILNVVAMEEGSNEVQVNNIGNTYAKPLIALEGTGNINIYLDNTQILQANVEDKMNIDIAKLEAYNPDTSVLLNRQVIGNYNSMTIPSGTSIIRMDGELTKATITNYTRWL